MLALSKVTFILLEYIVWNQWGIKLLTKQMAYKIIVVSILFYESETGHCYPICHFDKF